MCEMDKQEIIDIWEETIESLRNEDTKGDSDRRLMLDGRIGGIEMCIRQLKKWGK